MKSAPRASKNGLYKMREPKPIFWAKPCPAQNDGLCRARAHPFCAGNFKGDELLFCGSSVLETRILKEATFLGEKLRAEILSWCRWRATQATKAWSWQEVLIYASFPSTGSNRCVRWPVLTRTCRGLQCPRTSPAGQLSRKGRLCERCSATSIHMGLAIDDMRQFFFVHTLSNICTSIILTRIRCRGLPPLLPNPWIWDWQNLGDTNKIS